GPPRVYRVEPYLPVVPVVIVFRVISSCPCRPCRPRLWGMIRGEHAVPAASSFSRRVAAYHGHAPQESPPVMCFGRGHVFSPPAREKDMATPNAVRRVEVSKGPRGQATPPIALGELNRQFRQIHADRAVLLDVCAG